MEKSWMFRFLKLQLSKNGFVKIPVRGESMVPTLQPADQLIIKAQPTYQIGDVLVYDYFQGKILVHRLLKIQNNTYFCKGDNSFRLEDIKKDQILGKVTTIMRNDRSINPPIWSDDMIELSYQVSRVFKKCAYLKQKTVQTDIYNSYVNTIQKYYNAMDDGSDF